MFKLILFILLFKCVDPNRHKEDESSIRDVNQVQLDRLLDDAGYLAVYWYARNCKRSENILKGLETIDDDAAESSVSLVKINDKRYGKSLGIKKFPALTFMKNDEDTLIFEGDLKNKEEVLEFLTDEDNLAMPENIELVDAETLIDIVEQEDLVAVFFYDESKVSAKALESMENIDDDTDQFNIKFLRINDPELADDYSLPSIPALVFFRYEIPVVYQGDLQDESEVLEWLIVQRTSADEQDTVEFVNTEQMDIMVENMDYLLVIFLDNSRMSKKVFDIMETMDDDCDDLGVSFVAVRDKSLAAKYTIDEFPTLVYFEKEIPSVFDGDLENVREVLDWMVELVNGDHIEEVNSDILDKFIATKTYLAVLFYTEGEDTSMQALQTLEDIDDDLDQYGIMFVKIDDTKEAEEYGIEESPALVVFENGIPNLYDGEWDSAEEILDWIITESTGDDTIETVTGNMLDVLVDENDHVAVLFFDKNDEQSQDVLESLEHIDDDAVNFEFSIKLVKMDDPDEAEEYGVTELPSLLYFDKMIPNIYTGDLMDNEAILNWMMDQTSGSHVEEISNQILGKLVKKYDDVTVLFYSKEMKGETRLVEDLEMVDHILEEDGIPLVKIDDQLAAEDCGLEVVPGIVHFQYKEPHIYTGDLNNEKKIVEWVLETRNS